jgi:hypothetical protein
MPRYGRPAAYIADDLDGADASLLPAIAVPDHQPVDTGLVWATGEAIMRLPNPIGFGRDSEW